jgi:hypothetical protein
MLRVSPRLIGILLLAALPTSVLAQGIEIGPSVGYYRPLREFDPAAVSASDLPSRPSELSGVAWGAEMGAAFRNRIGIEATFSTIASTLPPFGNPGLGTVSRTEERVNILTLEAQYDVAPSQGGSQLLVSAGPTMIQHRGEGYSRYGSPGSWGGVAGLEFVHGVTQHLQLAVNLRGVLYSFNLSSPPQHGTQLDGLAVISVRWRVPLRSASPNEH